MQKSHRMVNSHCRASLRRYFCTYLILGEIHVFKAYVNWQCMRGWLTVTGNYLQSSLTQNVYLEGSYFLSYEQSVSFMVAKGVLYCTADSNLQSQTSSSLRSCAMRS